MTSLLRMAKTYEGGVNDHIAKNLTRAAELTTELPANVKAGRMYEVGIHASPDEFLDWDLPLSQQSEKVKEFFSTRPQRVSSTDPLGETLHKALSERLSGTGAMDELRKSGIKGIRYKDAGSRGKEAGTSNYVVFDDAIIDIMKKYGVALPVAAAIHQKLQQAQQQQSQSIIKR